MDNVFDPNVPEAVTSPEPPREPVWKKYEKPVSILAAVIVLAGGAYLAYARYTQSPERVWKTALQKTQDLKSGHLNIEGSYTDKVSEESKTADTSGFLGGLEEITVSMNAGGDFVEGEKNKGPDLDLRSTFGVRLGAFNVSVDAEAKKIGDNIYYKLTGNPLVGLLGGGAGMGEEKSDWLKIDLTRQDEDTNPFLKLNEDQIKQIEDTLKKIELVKPTELLGTEKVNGTNALHYKAGMDRAALKSYFAAIFQIFERESDDEKAKKELEDTLNAIADKLETRAIEIWIGKADRRIHQVSIETNAPSVFNSSLEGAQEKTRDARRVSDVRQMMTALELYFNDNNRYPAALSDLTKGKNVFIAVLPEAPAPPDGTCTEENNKYQYAQQKNGAEYQITFCLGANTSGLPAGITVATQNGMGNPQPDVAMSTEPAPKRYLEAPFTGTLKIKFTLSDFNKSVKIDEPADAIDYYQHLDNQADLNNAESTLKYSLQSYFSQNNRYPERLDQLMEADQYGGKYLYVSELPKPKNTSGECSNIADNWNYRLEQGGQSFTYEYCLTMDIKNANYTGETKTKGKHEIKP